MTPLDRAPLMTPLGLGTIGVTSPLGLGRSDLIRKVPYYRDLCPVLYSIRTNVGLSKDDLNPRVAVILR